MQKVLVRKTDKVKKLVYKILEIGENVGRRLNRPAWTGSVFTGGLTAFNHNHGKDFQKDFFKK